jgi:ketosteroid isomerase-like protein
VPALHGGGHVRVNLARYVALEHPGDLFLGGPSAGRAIVVWIRETRFMTGPIDSAGAKQPDDLGRLFLDRARRGDVEGVVALYEPTAVLASSSAGQLVGHEAIRGFYQQLLANPPQFVGEVQPSLQREDLALTSTRFAGGATAEVAHRQPDGTWLWVIDQPDVTAG